MFIYSHSLSFIKNKKMSIATDSYALTLGLNHMNGVVCGFSDLKVNIVSLLCDAQSCFGLKNY